MSSIVGTWRHDAAYGDSRVTTTQTIREDGSYETHMVYLLEGGCRQEIHHYGKAEVGKEALRLTVESGETRMTGCEDASRNFGFRAFTDEELEEANRLLDQEIRYRIEGDVLTTVVQGPAGPMEVVYERQ